MVGTVANGILEVIRQLSASYLQVMVATVADGILEIIR
jgi:hypothetical protein